MKRLVGLLSAVLFVGFGLVPRPEGPRAQAAEKSLPPSVLPLSEVVLYSSGVGYFQRDGWIGGSAAVGLRFKVDNINDLLKSMVVQDFGGGRVRTVTYDSRDPIAKTLKSFAVDLTANPGLGQLLEHIRGEGIEVAAPTPVRGVIVSVERKREKVGEKEVVEVQYLNLLTGDGLRSIPLSQIQRTQIANERLNAELRQALEVLAAGHDTQKKTVRLEFDGAGRRHVRVAYIMEMPLWKTSYRLALSDQERPFLQGWAIAENTTDEDWQNVKLSLISGRPISFTMDLYEPIYVKRPLVVPELFSSLPPQVYGQAMDAPPEGPRDGRIAAEEKALSRALAVPPAAAPGAPAGGRSELALQQGVTSAAEAMAMGELFRYAISTPVSLPRQKSAMLPIVSELVEGTKVSIYNERAQAKHPLNGFRLKNSTTLHLMGGPITVFDDGIYAGDARIEDLAPGQERLLSYAVDLGTEVEPLAETGQQELVAVSTRKGTLLATRKATEGKAYNIRNRERKKKVVVIEHPFRPDWRLTEPSAPTERIRDVYRFAVAVEAGKEARLRVHEEKEIQQTVRLVDSGPDLTLYFLQAKQVGPKVREALQRVVTLRDRVSQTAAQRGRLDQRVREITQEQARIRENMARLPQNSELYRRYVEKLDQQENELEKLTKEIGTLRATEDQQKRELDDYLLGLDIG